MARVIGNIPNFINGVSQQPAPIRLDSQMAEQINCYSTIAKGLVPRPGTTDLAKLLSTVSTDAWVHFINRDAAERFVAIYDDNASDTSYQTLGAGEMNFVSSWTNFNAGYPFAVTDEEFLRSASPDAYSPYYAIESTDVANSGAYLYPAFTHLANTTYTFSVWMSPPVSITGLAITLQGSDLVASATNTIGTPSGGWNRYEVTATTKGTVVGTGGTSAFEIKIVCDTGRIDVFCPMVSAVGSSAPLQSVYGGLSLPRLKVFDIMTGEEQQVWTPNGEGYMQSVGEPSSFLKAVTVADYTFVANSLKTCAMTGDVSAAQRFEALIVVDTVQPGSTISVLINGTLEAQLVISDTDPSDLSTSYVAAALVADMRNAGTHSGDLSLSFDNVDYLGGAGNVIFLKDSVDFTVSVSDGSNTEGIRVVKKQVQTFGELPRIAEGNTKFEVKGNANNDWSSFWVKYDGVNGTDGVYTWSETLGPEVAYKFDRTTMPHTIVYTTAGHFSLNQGLWQDQLVGDEVTNAQPSFVGGQINDIFFTEGRLGLLSSENVIFSQATADQLGVFNFWRTSVTSLLDGDPIDVSATSTKVSILRHAVPYQEQLLLFSDQTQFRLTKGDILSPKTVGIEPITDFESSPDARPATIGNFVFFVVEKSNYASVREYYVARDTETNDARDITGHVAEYIPSNVAQIRGTSNEDLVLLHSSDQPTRLYAYKYFWSGDRKVQSAWSYWDFPDVNKILGWEFFGSTLYLVMSRADGVFLESMELEIGAQDGAGLGFDLCLDRKILSTDSEVSAVYDGGSDTTTYTFANRIWKSVPKVVGIAGNSINYPPGYLEPIVGGPSTYDSDEIVLDGDTTGDDFLFGVTVPVSCTLSETHLKAKGEDNSRVPIAEGRLQIQRLKFIFTDTGYFKVTVDQRGRPTPKVYEYTGRSMGAAENIVNDVAMESSKLSIPIMSKNDRVTVTISSDSPLPFRMLSADWTGNFHEKGKRI